ncbi:restriction endonuclease subunit S [Aliarcobacter butzleri]|uniref:restriction endonuclease subunit S n=1 Tax=Aliarcobacter butzleri TaxID=28197 RepID=UPI0021B45202|nr:restriction endonuclease subunit S [Aliarcobacter butzleri]MCT7620172.1 restriction endonuclease subunit S [Aliarcobacter butzleri]
MSEKTMKNIPKLRFPEFIKSEEWENTKLGEICKFVRGPFGGSLKKEIFVKDGYAVYEQTHAIYEKFNSFRYYITEEKFNELKRFSVDSNDIIMSCSGTMGKFAIIPKHSKKGVINQALLKLTVKKEFNVNFIKTTLELPENQEKLLSQSAGGAIKNVVSVNQIKDILVFVPNLLEQKKIADCLSSVDSLITAQSQKVELLKEHKNGLLQNLFPKDGENIPKIRFPEFINNEEWEEKQLGNLLDYEQPTKYLVNDTRYDDRYKTPVLTAGKTFILGYTDETNGIFRDSLPIIIFDDFTTATQFVDFPFKAKSSAMKILKTKSNKFNIKLIFELIQRIDYKADEHKRYWISEYQNITIKLPKPKEQQKIADCLTSIDNEINLQIQKVESLKEHKKALLQQLFPSNEVING